MSPSPNKRCILRLDGAGALSTIIVLASIPNMPSYLQYFEHYKFGPNRRVYYIRPARWRALAGTTRLVLVKGAIGTVPITHLANIAQALQL